MATIFTLLRPIRDRPGQFLLGGATDRVGQLQRLEMLLVGYDHALTLHEVDEPGLDFVRLFGHYLRETHGWSTPMGPIATVLDEVHPPEAAWDRFWELVDEYEEHLKSQKQHGQG